MMGQAKRPMNFDSRSGSIRVSAIVVSVGGIMRGYVMRREEASSVVAKLIISTGIALRDRV